VLRRVPEATWGGKRKKEKVSKICIASDGSELVPTTDAKITLPYHYRKPEEKPSSTYQYE